MNDKGRIAPYLASSLVMLFKPEKSLFRVIKDLNSTKMNEVLINGGIPVTLFSSMLTFTASNKSFKFDGDLLETMKNFDFNVSHSIPQDQRLIHEFGKEMDFNIRQKGRKCHGDKSLMKLIRSPAIMASGISTKVLPSHLNEVCERWKLLVQ